MVCMSDNLVFCSFSLSVRGNLQGVCTQGVFSHELLDVVPGTLFIIYLEYFAIADGNGHNYH